MSRNSRVSNPFPGLRPFETDEYLLFFGREGQSDALVERLERARFLAVVGTSGSGKSSLVRAGLLPALRGGMMAGAGAGWRVAIMRPGHDPLGNLAQALAGEGVLAGDSGLERAEAEAVVEATLRRGSLGLVGAARAARLGEREKLLVVVDQFEELFRFRAARAVAQGTDDDASAFVKLLLEAARQREVPVYVVLTMRSDFLGDSAQFQGLPEAINDGQYLIPRMTRDERRFAIVGPARVARGKMTEPLVNRLLNDVGDNPDQLPILQHALMRTWDYWLGHHSGSEPVGLEHYEAVGTMSDALSLHADEAYNELPDERSRRVAELLFKALTERGADNREIRRPTRLGEVCAIAGATAAEVAAVVDVFRREGRSFLMPPAGVALTPETVIDISHESLIRNWERLRDWVRDEGEAARIYRRLAEAAAAYRAGEGGLLDDVTLGWVNRWRDRYEPNRAWGVRYHPGYDEAMAYLEESRAARAAEAEERERQRAAEVERERHVREQAEAFAQQQRRAARRMRLLALGAVVMFFLALAGGGYAYTMGEAAKQNAKAAQLAQKAAEVSAREAHEFADRLAEKKRLSDEMAESLKAAKADTDKALAAEKAAVAEQEKALREQQVAAAHAKDEAEKARRAEKAALVAKDAAVKATTAANLSAESLTASMSRSTIHLMGIAAFRRGNYQDAEEAFRTAQRFFEEEEAKKKAAPPSSGQPGAKDDTAALLALQGIALDADLGATQRKLGQHGNAVATYEGALARLRRLLPPEPSGRFLWTLFDLRHALGHAYREVAEGHGDEQKLNEEEKKRKKESYEKARENYEEAVRIQEKLLAAGGEDVELASHAGGFESLARLYRDLGDFDKAEAYYRKMVELRRSKNPAGPATIAALKDLAEFYSDQGRLDEAERAYNELIDVQEGVRDFEMLPQRADSYGALGLVYNAQADRERDEKGEQAGAGKAQRAEQALQVANLLQQVVLTGRKEMPAFTQGTGAAVTYDDRLDELGDAYVKLGRFAQAEEVYTAALTDVRLSDKAKAETRDKQRFSYLKLGDLRSVHLKDAAKAQADYSALVAFYESWPRTKASPREREAYADALDRLGRLLAKDPKTYPEAEKRLQAAQAIYRELSVLKEDATLAALADLYARQNKEAELKRACDRRLEILSRYLDSSKPAFASQVARMYVKAAGEVANLYASRNDTVWAEDAYAKLFSSDAKIRGRLYDPARLAEYAALLEKYAALLRDSNKTAELAKVEPAIKAVQARQSELRLIQEQQRAAQAAQQDPAQAAP